MNYTTRLYRSQNDLYEIGRLIRRAYGKRRYFNRVRVYRRMNDGNT